MSARAGGPLPALVGAFVLTSGAVATWLRVPTSRAVGGVPVTGEQVRAGTEYAAAAVPVALGALALAVVALLGRGLLRRVVGAAVAAAGLAAVALLARGLRDALADTGAVTAAPWAALLGAALVLFGGLRCLRDPRPRPMLDARYTVEGGDADDDEWRLAAEEQDRPA